MTKNNLFTTLPQDLSSEVFETLANGSGVRIERIVSLGHSTPNNQWYDQDDHEWVILLKGSAEIQFDCDKVAVLSPGDYLNIPAHTRHRVSCTAPNTTSIWLAVHYR